MATAVVGMPRRFPRIDAAQAMVWSILLAVSLSSAGRRDSASFYGSCALLTLLATYEFLVTGTAQQDFDLLRGAMDGLVIGAADGD